MVHHQLIDKKHHYHLHKRAILELIGLVALFAILISQYDVLRESAIILLEVDAVWFILLLSLFWILQPITVMSYKLLTPKPKRFHIKNAVLAHLAGAGPGRIVPGGIGSASISALHLKKTGLTIEQAVAVVTSNNLIGLFTNLLLIAIAITISPDTISIITDQVTTQQLIVLAIIIILLIVLFQWAMHIRQARREIRKTLGNLRKTLRLLARAPKRLISLVLLASCVTLMHSFMLDVAAYAIDVDLNIVDAFLAISFGVAIGGILPTPGGVGGVETGISLALITLGVTPIEATTIAVLLRVATYWQPLIPGTLSYLYLRERKML